MDEPTEIDADQDLSENVDNAGDTQADADDADEDKDDENRKRIVILVTLVISIIAVLAFIGVGIFVYYKFGKLTPIEIVQKKCKESINLACSLQSSSNKGPSQIVGGDTVRDRKMFPHQVYLQFIKKDGGEFRPSICGGSLISEKFVITAAHCILDVDLDTMKVLVGSLKRKDPNIALWKAAKKLYVHPDYNDTDVNPVADLGLIELEVDVEFNSDIRPICLNTKLEKRYNNSIYATGWGLTMSKNSSAVPNDLKMTEVRIDDESDKHCRKYLGSFSPERRELLNKTTICVAHLGGGGTHVGDSGGPLQVKLQSNCENTWEQIGICSVGTVYTNTTVNRQTYVKVEYYIPWIVSVVWPD